MNNSTKAGTLVLGSMPLFIRMFNNTITTSGQQTFTARYVPTQDAIPTLILMQDTGNAGLMLGMKGEDATLKSFASIFKSEDDYLNIKSGMGEIESEYGLLRMNRLQLSFNKDLRIIGNSTFERNVDINGHVDSEFSVPVHSRKRRTKILLNWDRIRLFQIRKELFTRMR